MSNYVKNLMKAAGVEKQYYSFKSADGNTYNWELNENGNEKHKKHFIGEPELKERIFTPAKQLELIKLLAERMSYGYIGGQIDYFTGTEALVFDEAIAQIISNAISSKILDKSEVRRILSE